MPSDACVIKEDYVPTNVISVNDIPGKLLLITGSVHCKQKSLILLGSGRMFQA